VERGEGSDNEEKEDRGGQKKVTNGCVGHGRRGGGMWGGEQGGKGEGWEGRWGGIGGQGGGGAGIGGG